MPIFDFLFKKKPVTFVKFQDTFGNFEIRYPKTWKFDHDIAVVDGQYTNYFYSNDSNFIIAINANIPSNFNFQKYAKNELESPTSGIYSKAIKSKFRGLPAFTREYGYRSQGTDYFGGGIMFFTGKLVFSISWSAPKSKKEDMDKIFGHMLKSLVTIRGVGS